MEPEPVEERKEARRQPRSRSDRRAETQVRRQQKSTELDIPYACFKRLARETLDRDVPQSSDHRFRFKPTGVKMLQQAAEALIVTHFQAALVSSRHKGRRGVMGDDIWLVEDIQRVLAHKEPLHMKAEPAPRRKRSYNRAPANRATKKVRMTEAEKDGDDDDDELTKELEGLMQPISGEEEEEQQQEASLEKEIEREPDSTDFQYEREEPSDQY